MEEKIKVKYEAKVSVSKGRSSRVLYEHQKEAVEKMNELNRKDSFSSLLVLPTGGGKTATAVHWLLKEAVNNKKKIIWVAHRHLLLEQAADTFKSNAYSEILSNISSFKYRIVSGKHDRAINIDKDDDILIIGKDSAVRSEDKIKNWLNGEKEVYLVIDEAHHSTAKSYRKLIELVKSQVKNVKLLGLTATPFRTEDNERGLLAQIYTDDIVFKVDLKELIKKEILSRFHLEKCETEINVGNNMGLNALKSIKHLDSLPDDIANEIAENKERNKVIINRYIENADKYGQTIVFAINRLHAFALRALFEKEGIPAAVIVSGQKAEFIGIDISDKETEKHINDYREGKIKVLINVNILTEGIDLPQTKTVFLARPTISKILMTQMVGRALRGEKAGGTKEAYVVSFIDNWEEYISWASPETLDKEEGVFEDSEYKAVKGDIRLISIAKIEEFAKIMDDTVDTSLLESISFMKRVPLGMYAFTFIDDNNIERNHQILVYDSTKEQYENFINDLGLAFEEFNITEEYIEDNVLERLLKVTKDTYFDDYMLPKYDENDIINVFKYYAQKECKPKFIDFNEIDRKKLNLADIAKDIVDKDMRRSEMNRHIESLWNDEDGIIRIYFNKYMYFKRQLDIELDKSEGTFESDVPKITYGERELNKLSLYEISEVAPEKAKKIKDTIYSQYIDKKGLYTCKECGYKSEYKAKFQIDHIIPRAKGGLSIIENLQLLCSKCNGSKSDK